MKFYQGIQRFFIFLMMTLTICHSTLPLIAATSNSPLVEQLMIKGKLKNGLQFCFIPTVQLKEGILIKMKINIPRQENESLPLLTRNASFYGTKEFSRETLIEKLNELKLDIEGQSFQCSVNENEMSLQVALSDFQKDKIALFLLILNQMILHPTLADENIEKARNLLLEDFVEGDQVYLSLQKLTSADIREFHEQWIRPEKMELFLLGQFNTADMTQILEQAFDSSVETLDEIHLEDSIDVKQESSGNGTLDCFIQSVELATDNQSWVVDKKIWMKEPNWINKSSNGQTLGAVLTAMGIGGFGMVLAFPIIAPVAAIGGALSAMSGIYLLSSDYLKDPSYIESLRQKDLKMGFEYAYKKGHAGITLTPFERRALFIQEIVQTSHRLSKSPILLLADDYQLNEPVIAELFNSNEFTILSKMKGDFIQQRNQYKMLKNALEQELASLTAPYKDVRDLALYQARSNYSQNYHVTTKNNLQASWDASIDQINAAYENKLISSLERDDKIAQTEIYYENCFADPNLKAGLEAADAILAGLEATIYAAYDYQVEQCKFSMQYDIRMERLKKGKDSLIYYFDEELIETLSRFPLYVDDLPDYLDLRAI